jgi:hypothetical protein
MPAGPVGLTKIPFVFPLKVIALAWGAQAIQAAIIAVQMPVAGENSSFRLFAIFISCLLLVELFLLTKWALLTEGVI